MLNSMTVQHTNIFVKPASSKKRKKSPFVPGSIKRNAFILLLLVFVSTRVTLKEVIDTKNIDERQTIQFLPTARETGWDNAHSLKASESIAKRSSHRVWSSSFYVEDGDMESVPSKPPTEHKPSENLKTKEMCLMNESKAKPMRRTNPPYPPIYDGKVGMMSLLPRTQDSCFSSRVWHTFHPVTCNILHEIDIVDGMINKSSISNSEAERTGTLRTGLLSSGSRREAWLMTSYNKPVIVKMLRFEREYIMKEFEPERIDALATERLTASPYVVNSYGFCGTSIMNEFADGGDLHDIVKISNVTISPFQKLIYSCDAALGLADIHGIDGMDHVPTLLHRDIRPHNFLLVDGQLKFHDFNNARVLTRDYKTGKLCGFGMNTMCGIKKSSTHKASPQECSKKAVYISSKADVYELGTFFFRLLTNDIPYKFEPEGRDQPLSVVKDWVLDKDRIPTLPQPIEDSDDPAIQAIIKITRKAMTYDQEKRPTAKNLSTELVRMTNEVLEKLSNSMID